MASRSNGKRIGITWHAPSGQYRKYVGKQLGRNGSPQPRCFYLGADPQAAMEKALALTLEWTAIERQGYVVWPQERSGAAGTAIGGGTEEREVNASDVTLEDAVKIYIAEQESRVLAARVSDRHAEACRHRLSRMLAFMGPKRRVCDIGQDDLMRLVNHFVSRPNALDANGRDFDPPRPIAIATVAMLVKAAKYFFEWLSEHDAIEWEKPKRFRQIFRIDRGGMLTEAERERRYSEVVSREVRHFTMDDLGRLYKIADGRIRAFILLALNCGFTQRDLSELRVFEVYLDAPVPYIHRERSKTGVEARWELWPETVEAIRREMAEPNPLKRVFLTERGEVLQEGGHSGRDSVRQAWRLLREKFVGELLPFKFLRKTGAGEIKRIGGFEISEMYLAHQEPGLNKHYANRNWSQMWEALREYRRRLVFLEPGWIPGGEKTLFTLNQRPYLGVKRRPAKATKRNRLGLPNVSFHKGKGKYYARVFRGGRTISSGYYATPEEASLAAERLRQRLDEAAAA
jgi:hypothetical protein